MRLSEPKIEYLPYGESFTWDSRNMPVFENCGYDKGQIFCVSHKLLMNDETWKTHKEHKSTHIVVWYCEKHKLMEEM
jgi:hypothetical protein